MVATPCCSPPGSFARRAHRDHGADDRDAGRGPQYGGRMRRDASHRRNHCSAAMSLVAGLLAAACLLVGCSGVTQTPFQHRAGEAAGTLAAAAETLRAVQEGRLTEGYARASFVSFAEAVQGVGEELPSMDGAPEIGLTEPLRRELQDVELVLREPCLETAGCDVSAQIRQLKAVSQDLLRTSQP
jgi:hypothetical protein